MFFVAQLWWVYSLKIFLISPDEKWRHDPLCQYSLHLGVMSFMLDLGISIVYWIFVGWAAFLETLFSQLNLKGSEGYLLKKILYIFVKTGHGISEMVIDCTEF